MIFLISVLLAVAAINQAIDMNDQNKLEEALENPDAKLRDVDESLSLRYLSHFVAVKKEKQEVRINIFCVITNYFHFLVIFI